MIPEYFYVYISTEFFQQRNGDFLPVGIYKASINTGYVKNKEFWTIYCPWDEDTWTNDPKMEYMKKVHRIDDKKLIRLLL